jgi:hypothetical protein
MKKWWMLVAVLLVIIIIGVIILVVVPANTANAPTTTTDNSQATTTPVTTPNPLADLIVVDTPTSGAAIASPLVVTGKARGTFYFEASFPVKLKNASGSVIAQAPAQAQSDWMTADFVPFKVTLTFPAQPAGSKGTLVLMNDNPSGDPAKQLELDIPVTF